MPQTIIGQNGLIDVEHVAGMLRSLAPSTIDASKVDWRANAERAISFAKSEVAKSGGLLASAEQLSALIFDWALDERIRLMRATESSNR